MTESHDRERVETIVEKAEYVEACLEILVQKQSLSREAYARTWRPATSSSDASRR